MKSSIDNLLSAADMVGDALRQTLRRSRPLARNSRARYDGVVKRLIRILFLVAILAPLAASVAVATDAFCEEAAGGCCTPEGVCDIDCVVCTCCASRIPSVIPFLVAEPILNSPRLATAAVISFSPQAFPTDIFHVPKSL